MRHKNILKFLSSKGKKGEGESEFVKVNSYSGKISKK